MSGALVNPNGDAVAIKEAEHKALKAHLEILRSKDEQFPAAIIKSLTAEYATRKADEARGNVNRPRQNPLVLAVRGCIDDKQLDGGTTSVLVHQLGYVVEELTTKEMGILKDTLKAVRFGGWFARWLESQVWSMTYYAEPHIRYPTPLKIMGTLVDVAEGFENNCSFAREMVEMRPDLFVSALKPAEESPATQPTPKSPE